MALLDRVADRHVDGPDGAIDLGNDLVLHLHRLEHDERFAGAYPVVSIPGDGHNRAGERRQDGLLSGH